MGEGCSKADDRECSYSCSGLETCSLCSTGLWSDNSGHSGYKCARDLPKIYLAVMLPLGIIALLIPTFILIRNYRYLKNMFTSRERGHKCALVSALLCFIGAAVVLLVCGGIFSYFVCDICLYVFMVTPVVLLVVAGIGLLLGSCCCYLSDPNVAYPNGLPNSTPAPMAELGVQVAGSGNGSYVPLQPLAHQQSSAQRPDSAASALAPEQSSAYTTQIEHSSPESQA